jgi:hypothetical protein
VPTEVREPGQLLPAGRRRTRALVVCQASKRSGHVSFGGRETSNKQAIKNKAKIV